ncbi:polysaccharide deacetylase family protein [Asanoa iriomotensis]|nr:polysaccharide deacetylase family protein [Asanoa iriomotensis]
MTTGTQQVALTFDDGPDPTFTPQVLALLRQYHVKATFCVVGELVALYPDLTRAIAADGHTLCNHTWSHDIGFASQPPATMRAELERTSAEIHNAAPGAKISYFRQPGGEWSAGVVAVAKDLGMSSLHWAVDPQDWTQPGAATITSRVEGETDRGSIVLLHDGGGDRAGTVEALKSILPDLTQRFTLVALPPGDDPPRQTPAARTMSPREPSQR